MRSPARFLRSTSRASHASGGDPLAEDRGADSALAERPRAAAKAAAQPPARAAQPHVHRDKQRRRHRNLDQHQRDEADGDAHLADAAAGPASPARTGRRGRIKRIGATLGKKTGLTGKSRGLLTRRLDKRRGSSNSNVVLKTLIQHRKDHDRATGSIDDAASDLTADDRSSITSASEPSRHRPSIRRGVEWTIDAGVNGTNPYPGAAGSSKRRRHQHQHQARHAQPAAGGKRPHKRVSVRHVSLRGFTEVEGLVTRAEAMSFSHRYSLQRTRAMTAEEVLGRSSISKRSLVRLAKKGDVEKVVALIELGNLDVNSSFGDDRVNPLIAAAAHGHTALVIALYGLDADLELADRQGNTALIAAADRAHLEVVLTLLSCGADPAHRNKDKISPLVAAAQRLSEADDDRTFNNYLQIMRAFFERAAPTAGASALPEYGPKDAYLVQDEPTRVLLNEWLQARLLHKDLHMPSRVHFHGTNVLADFFCKAHSRLDLYGWVKIFLLLLFIVYDTYSPHFENTQTTMGVYIFLYCAAYYC